MKEMLLIAIILTTPFWIILTIILYLKVRKMKMVAENEKMGAALSAIKVPQDNETIPGPRITQMYYENEFSNFIHNTYHGVIHWESIGEKVYIHFFSMHNILLTFEDGSTKHVLITCERPSSNTDRYEKEDKEYVVVNQIAYCCNTNPSAKEKNERSIEEIIGEWFQEKQELLNKALTEDEPLILKLQEFPEGAIDNILENICSKGLFSIQKSDEEVILIPEN